MDLLPQKALFSALIAGAFFVGSALAEEITLNTYYPAPALSGGGSGALKTRKAAFGDNTYYTALDSAPDGTLLAQNKVGIGTTTPYVHSRLHVKAPTSGTPWGIMAEAQASDRVIGISHTGTEGVIGVSYLTNGGYTPLQLQTSNLPRMTIDTSGNVGIGTASPAFKLEVLQPGQSIAYSGYTATTLSGFSAATAPTQLYEAPIYAHSTNPVAANVGGGIGFGGIYQSNSGTTWAFIHGKKENATPGNTAGYLQFVTRDNAGNFGERMRITSAGNVGIGAGATNPQATLHVATGGTNQNFWVRNDGTQLNIGSANDAASNWSPVRFDASSYYFMSGNVGIGTTSPTSNLEINSSITNNSNALTITRTGGAATGASTTLRGISVVQTSANDTVTNEGIYVKVDHNVSQGATGINASASTVYSTAVGVLGSGEQSDVNGVGMAIGVKGVASAQRSGPNGSTVAGYFDNTSTVGSRNYGLYIKTASAGTYGLYYDGFAPSYFGSKVGIGTAPLYSLHVQLRPPITGTVQPTIFGRNDNASGLYQHGIEGVASSPSNSAGVYGFTFASGGNAWGVLGQVNDPGSGAWDVYAANGRYGGTSSIRWKLNIQPIEDALEKVTRLRGVTFDWDEAHGGGHAIGMIGEEVGAVFPELVTYEADGKYVSGMDYTKVGPILLEAVKELKAQNDAQQREIEELKKALSVKK